MKVVDTGLETMTGGRIKRIQPYIGNDPFLLTYGDGVSDVDVSKTVEFHRSHGKMVTLTGVRPEGRFGVLDLADTDEVMSFREKRKDDMGWINAGYMVCDPQIFESVKEYYSNIMLKMSIKRVMRL